MLAVIFIQYNVQENIYLYLSHYLYSMIFFLLIFCSFSSGFTYINSSLYLALGLLKNSSIESNILFVQSPKTMIYQKF